MNRKKVIITMGLTLLLCLPVINNSQAVVEIDWVLKENLVDWYIAEDFVTRAEEYGFQINIIFVTEEEMWDVLYTGEYDLLSYYAFWPNDDFSAILAGLFELFVDGFVQYTDNKLVKEIYELYYLYIDLLYASEDNYDSCFNKVLDKFHAIEKRIYHKQWIFAETLFYPYYPYYPDGVDVVDIMFVNSLGILRDQEMRKTISYLIDRVTESYLYYYMWPPCNAQPTVHLFSWSQYHDISLPNEIRI